jgi:hypothetical protein
MTLTPLPDGDGDQVMRSVDGAAQLGDYVAVAVLGVRVDESGPALGIALGQPTESEHTHLKRTGGLHLVFLVQPSC